MGQKKTTIFLWVLTAVFTVALLWYCLMGGCAGGAAVIATNILIVLTQAVWSQKLQNDHNSDN